jgi:hypothetical protein
MYIYCVYTHKHLIYRVFMYIHISTLYIGCLKPKMQISRVFKTITLSSSHDLTINVPYARPLPEYKKPQLDVSLRSEDDPKLLSCLKTCRNSLSGVASLCLSRSSQEVAVTIHLTYNYSTLTLLRIGNLPKFCRK